MTILTLNAGSSSLKFGLFAESAGAPALLRGQVSETGGALQLTARYGETDIRRDIMPSRGDSLHLAALRAVLDLLDGLNRPAPPRCIGHRIVHGGADFRAPVIINPAVRSALASFTLLAPLHQPHNLAGIDAAGALFPRATQVACFDTAFHRGHPFVNDVFAIPRRFYEEGVRRYGFHGLSYDYISRRLRALDPALASGRVIVAHLGNGASMCALKGGKSVGSTMGFSALDGLPMGTRCGQIDPGVLLYLMDQRGMSVAEVTQLLYRESGLRGLSGLSHDMRTLESADDPRARQAIDYFVFRIRRELGAMAAVLGGLDGVVFTGGIGENSSLVRERVCADMGWIGLDIDPRANERDCTDVLTLHPPGSRVACHAIRTDEERMIADYARELVRQADHS